jgi:hypothetical protein
VINLSLRASSGIPARAGARASQFTGVECEPPPPCAVSPRLYGSAQSQIAGDSDGQAPEILEARPFGGDPDKPGPVAVSDGATVRMFSLLSPLPAGNRTAPGWHAAVPNGGLLSTGGQTDSTRPSPAFKALLKVMLFTPQTYLYAPEHTRHILHSGPVFALTFGGMEARIWV